MLKTSRRITKKEFNELFLTAVGKVLIALGENVKDFTYASIEEAFNLKT